MIWLLGLLAFIVYRTFNAGMKSDSLFYSNMKEWTPDFMGQVAVRRFDGNKLFSYGLVTIGVGLTWPISLPCIGIYFLGKRYAK
jgi:hypothetical protein